MSHRKVSTANEADKASLNGAEDVYIHKPYAICAQSRKLWVKNWDVRPLQRGHDVGN